MSSLSPSHCGADIDGVGIVTHVGDHEPVVEYLPDTAILAVVFLFFFLLNLGADVRAAKSTQQRMPDGNGFYNKHADRRRPVLWPR